MISKFKFKFTKIHCFVSALALGVSVNAFSDAGPAPYPSMLDPKLQVGTFYDDFSGGLDVASDTKSLRLPIGMAFLPNSDPNVKYDILVIEKNTGKVKRIKFDLTGAPIGDPVTVLDLAVNSFSERGLLGITVHPDIKNTGGKVYLFFTEFLPGVNNTPNSFVTLSGAKITVSGSTTSLWVGPGATDLTPLATGAVVTGTTITAPTAIFNGTGNITIAASASNPVILPAGSITADDLDDTSQTRVTNCPTAPYNCDAPPLLGADSQPFAADSPKTPLLGNRVAWFNWNPTATATLSGSGIDNSSNIGTGALTFGGTIVRLRAYQNDRNTRNNSKLSANVDFTNTPYWTRNFNGNHNGGKLTFGRDGKLYIMVGDNGRRGLMQNIKMPLGIDKKGNLTGKDDVFGSIAPDNAHFTGVILRLNDDGTTPSNNPFYSNADSIVSNMTSSLGVTLKTTSDNLHPTSEKAEVIANMKKIYAFGVRNGFGLAVDPLSGFVWNAENSGKSFEEVNLIRKGHNGAWVQMMGPSSRMDGPGGSLSDFRAKLGVYPDIAPDANYPTSFTGNFPPIPTTWGDFKSIETLWGIGRAGGVGLANAAIINTSTGPRGVQQPRFLPAPSPLFPNSGVIADSKNMAINALYMPPKAHLGEPLFSIKQVVPNGGIGFIKGTALGKFYMGDLIVGSGVSRQLPATEPNTVIARGAGAPSNNGYQETPYFYNWLVGSVLVPKPDGSTSTSNYGNLWRLDVKGHHRTKLRFDPTKVGKDGVVDNLGADDWVTNQYDPINPKNSLIFGLNFGTVTDIVTGPDGNLFVLSLTRLICAGAVTSGCNGQAANDQASTGRIYMISKVPTANNDDDDGDCIDSDSDNDDGTHKFGDGDHDND